jgi:hypothetical protein
MTPDGSAFVYQGVAPLVTRLIAYPFVDLTRTSLSALTIWGFAVAGNAVWTRVFLKQLETMHFDSKLARSVWAVCTCLAVWFLAPGLLLVANDSYYQEPFAIAYFLTALFCALVLGSTQKETRSMPLIRLALIAGLVTLARPNIALFLCAAVIVFAAQNTLQDRARNGKRAIVSLSIPLIIGIALFAYNYARFGDPLTMHGELSAAQVEMASTYFDITSPGAGLRAYAENGQFNVQRLPAGLIVNALETNSFPNSLRSLPPSDPRAIKSFGTYAGFVWLWLPFMLVAAVGLSALRRSGFSVIVLVAILGGVVILLSTYFASTLRYRFEYWPLIGVLAALGLPKVVTFISLTQERSNIFAYLLSLMAIYAAVLSVVVFSSYAQSLVQTATFGNWSKPICEHYVTKRPELGENAAQRLCYLDLEN